LDPDQATIHGEEPLARREETLMDRMRSGIIGTGFIGGVHAAAVRAAGGVVQAVASATPQGAQSAADAWNAEHATKSGLDLIDRDDIDVVHICTPNATHAELAHAAIAAGKAVVCEKPLAINPDSATSLVDQATAAGVVNAVPFIYRYYPTVREARDRISRDDAGRLWLLHGSYLQDWLSGRQVSNWRVDPKLGGTSRAFGDIGVHWCDLMEFVTGHRITRLVAHWANAHTERPSLSDTPGVGPTAVATEDGAIVTFETDRGAVGSVVVSQVSLGRKNRLWFSFDGLDAAYVFDQELPDSLWVGGLRENHVVPRGPDTLSAAAGRYARLPAGHPQGYQDSFTAFIADVYAAVAGEKPDGLPTFESGLRATRITAAVVESARSGNWVKVPEGP
jgi:predicted dehydrogenase